MKNNHSVLSNLSWKFAERISAQIVTLIVSIVLARILDPSHYGVISIVTIFITVANVFVSDGLGSALIQKKNPDALDYSTVLVSNFILSIILYLFLFFLAPTISRFYGEGYEILRPVLRILGLRIILSSINSVQQAYVSKQMIFHKFFFSTLFGTILSAIVGITMAYMGYGVWALVMQYLTNTTVDTIFLGVSLHKFPGLRFSFDRFKSLFSYGIKILGTGLLIQGFVELRALIIGKVYSSEDLAFYDKGKQFPHLIVTNINASISAVLFPKLSSKQDDPEMLKQLTRQSIRVSSYLMCPLMLGFGSVAENFVKIVLTEKWLPCVPLMQLFCVIYLFHPIHTANSQAIKAIGRSDIFLKLEFVKKVIELIALVLTMKISVFGIVVGMAICTTGFTFINAYPNSKLLGYQFNEQMTDIIPSIIMSLIMAIIVWLFNFLPYPAVCILVIQIIFGGVIYLFLSVITHNKEYLFIRNILFSRLKNIG